MISFFGSRHAANKASVDRLNTAVIAAVRAPAFYTGGGVPDTFNGRFELLVLHTALVVRRLRAEADPAPGVAQDLVDLVFRNLDPALRELGVGDMAVPKRMRALAEAFLGRSATYHAALEARDARALAAGLSRNVYGGARDATALTAYVVAAADGLAGVSAIDLLTGKPRFPNPAAFLGQDNA